MDKGRSALDILPSLCWIKILRLLSEEEQLKCKQVSTQLSDLVDSLPPEPTWNPWFPNSNHTADIMLEFKNASGSRFTCGDDILNFVQWQDQRHSDNQNPFINRTVIIDCKLEDDYRQLLTNIQSFTRQYGHHVWKLLYTIHGLIPESVEILPEILNNMPKLRSLIIQSHDGGNLDGLNKIILKKIENLIPLENLSELMIAGMNAPLLLEQLSRSYGNQIRSIHMWHLHISPKGVLKQINKNYPNLENLKIWKHDECHTTYDREASVPMEITIPLKRFAIKIPPQSGKLASNEFEQILLSSAGVFKNTLEMLVIDIKLPKFVRNGQMDGIPVFPLVKELAIPYFSVAFEPFLDKFPNLNSLILLDTTDEFKNRQVSAEELVEVCNPLWKRIPSSIQSISVRTRHFNNVLRRHFPKLYICSKTSLI